MENMNEELIKYETALLAKEKGFDINTTSNCWVKTLDGDIIHNSERRNCFEHDRCEYYLSQPTQSQLQKWLRDIHKINISINFFKGLYECDISYITMEKDMVTYNTKYGNLKYKDYEQCLEIYLVHALKYIKKHENLED